MNTVEHASMTKKPPFSTLFFLMAEYQTPAVELSRVCGKYMGLSEAEAKRRAARHQLPVPVFRCTSSNKCTWLLMLDDLADLLDQQRETAAAQFAAINS